MDTHSSRPWPLPDSPVADFPTVPQRVSWPRSSKSSRDSEGAQYRDEFRRLYDSTSEDVYRSPIPMPEIEIEIATPGPTHSSSHVEEAPVSEEQSVSQESKPPEQATEMRIPPDPNLVEWEGVYDPDHPGNWPSWKKTVNITIILMMCVTHAFATTALIPAIGRIQEEFGSNDVYLSALVVSAYVLGFTAGPLLVVPLAEDFGRVVMYHFYNILFISFTCWCAKTKNMGMLALARFLAGCGGAVTQCLAARSISDLVQGGVGRLLIIFVALAFYLTPAISPFVGSRIYFNWGWPWIFWVTAMMGGFCTLIGVALSETHEPILLRRKASIRIQRTHNLRLYTSYDLGEHPGQIVSTRFKRSFLQPLRILLSPSFFLTSFIPAAGYAILYMVYITLPQAFLSVYIWPSKNLGLAYFGVAVGIIIAIATGAATSEKHATLRARKNDSRAENRLVSLLCLWPFTGLGLCLYGYFLHQKMHWAGPVVSLGFVGAGVMFAIVCHNLHTASLAC
ncbi:hypothetical protein PMIN06_003894 [Paraphaeosphaeria minitans]